MRGVRQRKKGDKIAQLVNAHDSGKAVAVVVRIQVRRSIEPNGDGLRCRFCFFCKFSGQPGHHSFDKAATGLTLRRASTAGKREA